MDAREGAETTAGSRRMARAVMGRRAPKVVAERTWRVMAAATARESLAKEKVGAAAGRKLGRMKEMKAAMAMPSVMPRKMPMRASFHAMRRAVPVPISPRARARMTMVAACPPAFPPEATTMGRKSERTKASWRMPLKRNMT